MQYVRSFSGSVTKTWNSINPATLSGAIDVVVVEQEDGSLACSPFHVRFGKFSLLRPYEKKVEFRVNDAKQEYSMKLGEGGEAFFVFETSADIPQDLQTSPLVSPAASPSTLSLEKEPDHASLQEPEFLDLSADSSKKRPVSALLPSDVIPLLGEQGRAMSDLGRLTPLTGSPPNITSEPIPRDNITPKVRPKSFMERANSDEIVPVAERDHLTRFQESRRPVPVERSSEPRNFPSTSETLERGSSSPPLVSTSEAVNRAISLSKKLSSSKIPTHVTDSGDLMLDINGYKSSEEDALRAEVIARKILSEELEGNYDIGALIGADERGNLWIYSSEEAKEAANRRAGVATDAQRTSIDDSASDPGYQSDEDRSITAGGIVDSSIKATSDRPAVGLVTPPQTPPDVASAGDPNRNYAKTLRLTSDQLKALKLKPGPNLMSFSVNRATCSAFMYYWSYKTPVVISDIDGTITKSDALGHVLNMIGRDWTHVGVAKLYTDIAANGYNLLYLTSRSVGQADTTRAYLNGIQQDGYKLPRGPVILSPDRTIAALRREVYLRKPEVFKMACLRDIQSLFEPRKTPFYAGFGNRFTDALSYRSVNIPPNRIFTINSNAEVSLDLLTLNKYKSSYVSMREIVDHFFPPVGLLLANGGEDFTDFTYWRESILEVEEFSDSESEEDDSLERRLERQSIRSEDEGSEGDEYDDPHDQMTESYLSQDSTTEGGRDLADSIMESIEEQNAMTKRILEGKEKFKTQENGAHDEADDEGEDDEEDEEEDEEDESEEEAGESDAADEGPDVQRGRGRSPLSKPVSLV